MPSVGVPNVPQSMPTVRSFQNGESASFPYPYAITGYTLDSAGMALATCVVHLFRTSDDSLAGVTTSDANGLYLIYASPSFSHYAVAYKAGATDVAGTTINTLVGA